MAKSLEDFPKSLYRKYLDSPNCHLPRRMSMAPELSSSSSSTPSTDPFKDHDEEDDEESEPSSAGSSPNQPREGDSASLAFIGQHPTLTLQAGQVPSNTFGPRSASPVLVAAPPVVNQEQSVEPESAKDEEQVRPSLHRPSLALPGVSVKSRIAAFEKNSPTASTFGLSPPGRGKDDPASSSPVAPKKQEQARALTGIVSDLDLSETHFSHVPVTARKASSRHGVAPSALGKGAYALNPPSTLDPKEYTPQRLPPKPPHQAKGRSVQSPLLASKAEHFLAVDSVHDSLEQPEPPETPRFGSASLVLPFRPRGFGFPQTVGPPPRLRIPSSGRHLSPGSPLVRVKLSEGPGPRPKLGDALARQTRLKPLSRLSQVLSADLPVAGSPESSQTTLSPSDNSGQEPAVPENTFDIERSASTRRNRAATLRSLEGLEGVEEEASSFGAGWTAEETGWLGEFSSPNPLVPEPLRPNRTRAVQTEAKGSDKQRSTLIGADPEHPNLPSFSFSFDTVEEKGLPTAEKARQKPKLTLLPSLLPHPGYTPPNSPGSFTRQQGVSPATPIRGVLAAGLSNEPPFAGPTHHFHSGGSGTLSQRYAHLGQPNSSLGGEFSSKTMDRLRPESALAVSDHRREAMRLAKAQEASVVEKCRRSGAAIPEYAFDELIGKGSFGRVYKCRNTTTRKIVAVKVIDIDESDYRAHGEEKDEQIRAFQKEIKILRQAQESGAPNLNQMIEALPVHSQLWLVCEYCPGGSVKTLMRATNDRLVERYIVVIARELGKALKGLHAAGILHRDIKAANVLIHEEGRLQLCDFGVATVMETKLDKRRTFIGTLHWMPPEMWDREPEYSDEVDVWAFGCAIYECAMGRPPNSDLREPQQLKSRMRRLNKSIELPENENFPETLRSLVSYTLTPDAKSRPTMRDVLEHEYLANTEESHPTSILTELVNLYYTWLHGGGQRASLFIKGGAAVSEAPSALNSSDDEWNFSTTIAFEKRISSILDIDIDIPDIGEISDFQSNEGEATPKAIKESTTESPEKGMSATQKANWEARVRRGADLDNVFDLNKPNYEYKTKADFRPIQERRVSDLPLRVMAEDRPPSIASNEIDLGDFDSSNYATVAPLTKLIDASTIRAKRDDLKLSRESSSTRVNSAANVSTAAVEGYLAQQGSTDRPATQDFSFPPKEWQQGEGEDLETNTAETEQRGPKKSSVRKTMEWSFDTAMSETESEEPEPVIAEESRAKKHTTMQWSFPQAMAEAGTTSTSSVTPSRPAPMLRTITMPVTSSEIYAAEDDVPRPSTALSEAVSERSLASSEADPFALDLDTPGYPESGALDQRGISSYYHSEGSILAPEHTVPYNTTVAGPVPYPMGSPARIGEQGFPGPKNTAPAGEPVTQSGKKQKKKKGRFTRSKKVQGLTSDEEAPTTSSSPETSSPATSGSRRVVTMPAISPPAAEALDVNASPEQLERELGNMLSSFSSVLSAAGRVMGIGRRGRRGSRRRSSDEWESED